MLSSLTLRSSEATNREAQADLVALARSLASKRPGSAASLRDGLDRRPLTCLFEGGLRGIEPLTSSLP